MTTVRQLLAGKRHAGVVSIGPDASVLDALKLMAEHDIGAVPVIDGVKLVGIFSERDYARKVVLLGKSSRETRMRDIMTHRVVCVTPDHRIDECMALVTSKRCRHLPVLVEKRVVGLVSIGDIVKELISEQLDTIARLETYIMS